jgi:hypothetical protein
MNNTQMVGLWHSCSLAIGIYASLRKLTTLVGPVCWCIAPAYRRGRANLGGDFAAPSAHHSAASLATVSHVISPTASSFPGHGGDRLGARCCEQESRLKERMARRLRPRYRSRWSYRPIEAATVARGMLAVAAAPIPGVTVYEFDRMTSLGTVRRNDGRVVRCVELTGTQTAMEAR